MLLIHQFHFSRNITKSKLIKITFDHGLIPKYNEVMDVLTFNAFDNDNTPESPILFSMEFGINLTIISHHSKINSLPESIK